MGAADVRVTLDRIDAAVGRPGAFDWLPQLREHADAPMPTGGTVPEPWSGPALDGLVAPPRRPRRAGASSGVSSGALTSSAIIDRVHPTTPCLTDFELAVLRAARVPVDDVLVEAVQRMWDPRTYTTTVTWDWTVRRGPDGTPLRDPSGRLLRGPGGSVRISDEFARNVRMPQRARFYSAPVGTEPGGPGWTEITGATIDITGFGEA